MQLTFDPRDRNAATAALAVVLALHPDLVPDARYVVGTIQGFPDLDADGRLFAEGGTQADRLLPESVDPAEAFGGVDATQAFAVDPLVPAPVTASPTPAPIATSPVSSNPPPAGVEVDKHGLPWDGRIHSGPADKKPKNSDGTWRKKRGVDDATVAGIEAELRQVMAAPVPAAFAAPIPPAPEVAAAPVPPPPVPAVAPSPPVPAVAAPPVAPIAPAPTPAVAVAESGQAVVTPATSFADLMRKITGLQTSGALTVDSTRQIAESLGITGVRDLMARPDLIPSFDALLPVAP